MIKDKAWYPIVYMFLVTAVFSSVLIGLSRMTRDRVEANQQIAFEKAVLNALPIPDAAGLSSAQIHQRYTAVIQPADAASGDALRYIRDGELVAYALPFDGQGFWAPIKGVIGIEPDQRTLTGIDFYEQNETPGLGAEIVKPEFRSQFAGKQLNPSGPALTIMTAAEGSPSSASEVEAVTGATQTSTRLERMLNAGLSAWRDTVTQEKK